MIPLNRFEAAPSYLVQTKAWECCVEENLMDTFPLGADKPNFTVKDV